MSNLDSFENWRVEQKEGKWNYADAVLLFLHPYHLKRDVLGLARPGYLCSYTDGISKATAIIADHRNVG